MEIVINKCYGGFSISQAAAEFMADRGNKTAKKELGDFLERDMYRDEDDPSPRWYGFQFDRDDPDLVAAVKHLGAKANGECAELKIVRIPDGIEWELEDYDGIESIHEKHSVWY